MRVMIDESKVVLGFLEPLAGLIEIGIVKFDLVRIEAHEGCSYGKVIGKGKFTGI